MQREDFDIIINDFSNDMGENIQFYSLNTVEVNYNTSFIEEKYLKNPIRVIITENSESTINIDNGKYSKKTFLTMRATRNDLDGKIFYRITNNKKIKYKVFSKKNTEGTSQEQFFYYYNCYMC